jgi:hypothetical protein
MSDCPTWEPIWLACKACKHAWDDWQPCDVPPATWIAHVKTYHCPECGKGRRYVLIRSMPLSAEPKT